MLKETPVACFSELKDSILMWSHYADYHKGFCVAYDNKNSFIEKLMPVLYSPWAFNWEDMYFYFITKYIDWKYEEEWRYVGKLGEKYIDTPVPTAIYIGSQMENAEQIEEIKSIAQYLKCRKVYKMKMSYDKFELVSEEI